MREVGGFDGVPEGRFQRAGCVGPIVKVCFQGEEVQARC